MKKILMIVCALFALQAGAQTKSAMLSLDTGEYYFYEKQLTVTGKSKNDLYTRVSKWVETNMNPADNTMKPDPAMDSVKTVAFMEMEDLPEVQNQFVSFKVIIGVEDGKISFRARDFLFHGMNKATSEPYDTPLEELEGISETTATSIMFGFDKKFERLMEGMQTVTR